MPKQRADRPKKRKFTGNQYSSVSKKPSGSAAGSASSTSSTSRSTSASTEQPPTTPASATASGSKLRHVVDQLAPCHPTGYRIMDIELLIDFISNFPCPNCSSPCFGSTSADDVTKRVVSEEDVNANGLASRILFTCVQCRQSQDFHTSKKVDSVYEANSRFPLAISSIGHHYMQGKRLLANMNIPPPQRSVQAASQRNDPAYTPGGH